MRDMELHDKLQLLCTRRRWGPSDLSEAIGGIAKSTMHNWWNGKNKPDLQSALKMARVLEVPLDWLADDVADYPPSGEITEGEREVLNMVRLLGDIDEAKARLMIAAAQTRNVSAAPDYGATLPARDEDDPYKRAPVIHRHTQPKSSHRRSGGGG